MIKPSTLCLVALGLGLAVGGAEFFVAPGGNNNNRGTTPDQPWKTFKRAADSSAGDTLPCCEIPSESELNFAEATR